MSHHRVITSACCSCFLEIYDWRHGAKMAQNHVTQKQQLKNALFVAMAQAVHLPWPVKTLIRQKDPFLWEMVAIITSEYIVYASLTCFPERIWSRVSLCFHRNHCYIQQSITSGPWWTEGVLSHYINTHYRISLDINVRDFPYADD